MSYAPQIAAVVSLALVLGCEAPAGQDEVSSQASGFTVADPERPAPPVHGVLFSGDKVIADASVCILYSEDCIKSGKDGSFKLEGLLADQPEALLVFSPDHVPLIVPVQLRADQEASFKLELVRGDAFERTETGKVRFATQLISREMEQEEMEAQWTLEGGHRSKPASLEAASGITAELRPDVYVAQFQSNPSSHCHIRNGWAGPEAGSLSLPVLAGAMTHIGQVCRLAN